MSGTPSRRAFSHGRQVAAIVAIALFQGCASCDSESRDEDAGAAHDASGADAGETCTAELIRVDTTELGPDFGRASTTPWIGADTDGLVVHVPLVHEDGQNQIAFGRVDDSDAPRFRSLGEPLLGHTANVFSRDTALQILTHVDERSSELRPIQGDSFGAARRVEWNADGVESVLSLRACGDGDVFVATVRGDRGLSETAVAATLSDDVAWMEPANYDEPLNVVTCAAHENAIYALSRTLAFGTKLVRWEIRDEGAERTLIPVDVDHRFLAAHMLDHDDGPRLALFYGETNARIDVLRVEGDRLATLTTRTLPPTPGFGASINICLASTDGNRDAFVYAMSVGSVPPMIFETVFDNGSLTEPEFLVSAPCYAAARHLGNLYVASMSGPTRLSLIRICREGMML